MPSFDANAESFATVARRVKTPPHTHPARPPAAPGLELLQGARPPAAL